MSFHIAVCGKGGTGKTTISGVILRSLLLAGKVPVLVIDADADGNLADALGIKVIQTVGEVVEEMEQKASQFPPDVPKEKWLEGRLNSLLAEEKGFDFLSMGRGEGPGCYCFVNSVLRRLMDKIEGNYPYSIMDNAAGMEHLSRRTTRAADLLLIVSDHSMRGVEGAGRIAQLATELKLDIGKMGLVINRVKGDINEAIRHKAQQCGLEIMTSIPEDDQIKGFDLKGISLLELPAQNRVLTAVTGLLERTLS